LRKTNDMKANHNIDDWDVFKDVALKFAANFADIKVWTFTFVVAPLFSFTEKYLFADWEFLKYLAVFMMLDLATGIANALKDKEYDLIEENIQEGIYYINIHRANAWGTSTQIDKWSAGCQVIANNQNFDKLMELANKSKDKWGNSFTYTLIESKDIV
jgi:hypothetical protein